MVNAVELALAMELEHTGMLAGLAAWRGGRSLDVSPNRVGDREAAAWSAALTTAPPGDVVLRRAEVSDDRQFFHRLVNIENYPNTIELAREHATVVLDIAEEVLFEHGAVGVLTDASWFDYTADALLERIDGICRDKLTARSGLAPGTVALGSVIDGAWAHRIGNVGRYTRRSDGMLYSSYTDLMGRGDPSRNHVALVYRMLAGIRTPHIRDATFPDQDELPDHRYELPIYQLSLSLFPDTRYDEILGLNLGITMLGLGQARMPEPRRLRRHWLDVACDDTPLPLAGTSADHARQSAEIIIGYLDDVAAMCGPDAQRAHWRRIWRGYAAFALLVEPEPLGSVPGPADLMAWSLLPTLAPRELSTISVRR